MSTQSAVAKSRVATPINRALMGITVACYACLLLAVALSIPLQIPEVLQVAATEDLSPSHFFGWIAQAPASAPLNPLVQLPFLLVGGHSRLAARLVSIVFAVAACFLFLRLAKRVPLEKPYWALVLFMLLPVHLELSFQGKSYEQALFLVVLATGCFFRLFSRPGINTALLYAGSLTLCLYTNRDSFLPAIGYLLLLLRFVDRAQERRAMWHALAATVVPVILFFPYALWAHTQVHPDWFVDAPSVTAGSVYLRVLRSVAAERWAAYTLFVLLTVGTVAGAWASFRLTAGPIQKRIRLFVLFGGVSVSFVLAMVLDIWLGDQFSPSQLLWAAPATVVLICAAIEWLAKRRELRLLASLATALLIGICVGANAGYLLTNPDLLREDLQATAAAVPTRLRGNSCVVFVSQRFSRALFLVFQPDLGSRECIDFFHARIVLASHPYVTPDQQHDAESFFRGLNMVETHRVSAGGGQVVVMEQRGQ